PVHLNLVFITNYSIFMLAISCLGRLGQILYETGLLGERGSFDVFILKIKIDSVISGTISRYTMTIYCERCLALRFVRDYERNQRLYISAIYIVQDLVIRLQLIKRLLRENEIRLENLNIRDIRRPLNSPGTHSTLSCSKFFGDSSKDMYTLSLRLQLDENIWCCK
ncbi:hypothetical protein PMAYCL1PPCAC_20072, partial [Pristionchus mayeri]